MSLSTTVKSIQDIMRKDVGVDGDAQRIGQLVWLFFLKIWDDREQEIELLEDDFSSPLLDVSWTDTSGQKRNSPDLRWRSWAADPEGDTGDGLLAFVNDTLFDSLTAGNPTHPRCSAAIKELYGAGDTVLGHAVMVKVADGDGGDTWYWYELYEGSTFADGVGDSLCTGCHSSGTDFWRSPFPLQ